MSRWLDDQPRRAQVEPLAALVAVFAVGAALTAYTGVLGAALPTPDRNVAEPTVERVERAVGDGTGVLAPAALDSGLSAGPDGYRLNLTLRAGGRTLHAGPVPPQNADSDTAGSADAAATDSADLAVSVRIAPGRIRPGRLRAEVWS